MLLVIRNVCVHLTLYIFKNSLFMLCKSFYSTFGIFSFVVCRNRSTFKRKKFRFFGYLFAHLFAFTYILFFHNSHTGLCVPLRAGLMHLSVLSDTLKKDAAASTQDRLQQSKEISKKHPTPKDVRGELTALRAKVEHIKDLYTKTLLLLLSMEASAIGKTLPEAVRAFPEVFFLFLFSSFSFFFFLHLSFEFSLLA